MAEECHHHSLCHVTSTKTGYHASMLLYCCTGKKGCGCIKVQFLHTHSEDYCLICSLMTATVTAASITEASTYFAFTLVRREKFHKLFRVTPSCIHCGSYSSGMARVLQRLHVMSSYPPTAYKCKPYCRRQGHLSRSPFQASDSLPILIDL